MDTPGVADLHHVVDALSGWQYDNGPLHVHPGDLGWYSTRGAAATATAIRIWSRGGRILALGLLDGHHLLRVAVDPNQRDDEELAHQIVADVTAPQRGVLDAGGATIEARGARRFSELLAKHGWRPDEPWTPLHRDLATPVGDVGVRVESIEPDRADAWTAVHWSAFRGTPCTEEDRRRSVDRWRTMAGGPFYAQARSLAAFDTHDNAVAVAMVWTAGPGRPGLLEPMGVHRDHWRHGYGTAITLAAAATLREMGASSAIVCTQSSNVAAVSTYTAAGFTAHEQVPDLHRNA